jgi:hypothetical protein
MTFRKRYGAVFLMTSGASVTFAILEEEWLWWVVAVIFAFIGSIALNIFEERS